MLLPRKEAKGDDTVINQMSVGFDFNSRFLGVLSVLDSKQNSAWFRSY